MPLRHFTFEGRSYGNFTPEQAVAAGIPRDIVEKVLGEL